MKSRRIYSKMQGLLGGFFLVMGAAFIFMSFFSVSAAFADPVQVQDWSSTGNGINSPRGNGRAGPAQRSGAVSQSVRGVRATKPAPVEEDDTPGQAIVQTPSRAVGARGNAALGRNRSVRQRGGASAAPQMTPRTIVARTGTQARVGLTGAAIRASTGTQISTLNAKLSAVTYSN